MFNAIQTLNEIPPFLRSKPADSRVVQRGSVMARTNSGLTIFPFPLPIWPMSQLPTESWFKKMEGEYEKTCSAPGTRCFHRLRPRTGISGHIGYDSSGR